MHRRFGDDGKLWHIGVVLAVGAACWIAVITAFIAFSY